MKTALVAAVILVTFLGCSNSKHLTLFNSKELIEYPYVITAHSVIRRGEQASEDDYTIAHGANVLKVRYSESQTSSAKPGDFPGTGLHLHRSFLDPDLSQVPEVGLSIGQCKLSKDVMPDGSPIIAKQETPDPCMVQIGDTLHYELSPNAASFTYVDFDILSEKLR